MLRCTIELVPGGVEDHPRRHVIGVVEIANDGGGTRTTGHYKVLLKKSLPYAKIKNSAWRTAVMEGDPETSDLLDDVLLGRVAGFPRERLGPYDLLYRALKACGLEGRNG